MGGIEVRRASEADVADLTAIEQAVERAEPTWRPEIPLMAEEELRLWFFQFRQERPERSWIARDQATGEPVGWVGIELPHAANRHQFYGRVEVVPSARRQGIGSALLAEAIASVDGSRTMFGGHVASDEVAWCESLGLASKQVVRESRVDLETGDADVVRDWLDPVAAVAAGYRVVSWRGPTPTEHEAAVCVALTSMADAPIDDAEHEEPEITVELLRDGEASVRGRISQFGALALAPDGSAAGFTELGVHVDRPVLGHQGDTVVVAAHRGRQLGRWLKAVNLLAAIDAHPELRFIDTYNAESNPWMLAINEAMGYRPHREMHFVQGDRSLVEQRLAARRGVADPLSR